MGNPGVLLLPKLLQTRQMSQGVLAPHDGPSRVIAVCNQKGGCGKTTTAINLAAGLALKGYPTLLIDLDPQAHATLGIGVDGERLPHTVYDTFHASGVQFEDVILQTKIPNLSLIPANSLLAGAQLELATVISREQVLRRSIQRLNHRFQFLLIDCSPSLNLLTINALSAADLLLIPLQPHFYALEGVRELFSTVELIQERFNPGLTLLGILPVMVDGRAQITREVLQQIRAYFNEKVFQTAIRLSSKLIESSIVGQPVILYAPRSSGAEDYAKLTEEVLARFQSVTLVSTEVNGSSERTAG